MSRASLLLLAITGSAFIGVSPPLTVPVREPIPKVASVLVECRCCDNGTHNDHQFNSTDCGDLSAEELQTVTLIAMQFPQWQSPRGWSESETSEYLTSAFSGASTLATAAGFARLGEEEPCEAGWDCYRDWSGGGAGGGSGCEPDCDFHTGFKQGTCFSKHPLCGEESELVVEVLNAVDLGNYGLVAAYIKGQPSKMWLNSAREMLQIQDCQGRIATQVRVDVARLTELLQ